jgi:hypothetical protein
MFAVTLTLLALAFLAVSGVGVYSLIAEGLSDCEPGWVYCPSGGSAILVLTASLLLGLASAGLAYVLWYAFLNRY